MSAFCRVAIAIFALAVAASAVAQVGPIPGMGPLISLAQPGGSVAFDAKGTANAYAPAATSIPNYTLTIGTGNFRAVVAQLSMDYSTASPSSGQACTWNSVSMTFLQSTTIVNSTYTEYVSLWGLTGPTSGNKTLQCTWTGASVDSFLQGASFTGVNPAGGTISFPNCAGATFASGTAVSVSITSTTSSIVIDDAMSTGSITANTGTLTFSDTANGSLVNSFGQRTAGSSSVSTGYTINTAARVSSIVGCSIAP